MIINKSSWHYQLVSSLCAASTLQNPSLSLCKYFWLVVMAVVLLVGGVMVVGVFAVLLIAPILSSASFFLGYGTLSLGGIVGPATLVSVVIYFIIIVNHLINWFRDLINYMRGAYHRKEDGLVIPYIKTKKRGICPLVEFE